MAGSGASDRDRLLECLLVLRCQVGDESAFTGLYERFGTRTLRYLEGILGSDAAADAQQEVWLAVFRGIARVTNPGAFRTWLYQTTRHRAIDVLRKDKREADLLAAMWVDEHESVEAHPDPAIEPVDTEALGPELEGLSAAHREVLLLRYWEGMAYGEIAFILGCSVGTVRSKLHYAKRRLREALDRRAGRGGRAV
jgi:RNA polymerase sigma-70 factor (ECF subfamily)